LAFYLANKDEMFIRANLKGKKHDAVHTLLHELGHRLHFKFLKSRDPEIRRVYYQITNKEQDQARELIYDQSLRPNPGELYEERGKVYEVTKVVSTTVYLKSQADPNVQAKLPLLAWIRNKGVKEGKPVAREFVTQYAKKNHEENFAEMVAFYCLGQLPDEQVQLLSPLLS
jgi:hypothetical protein